MTIQATTDARPGLAAGTVVAERAWRAAQGRLWVARQAMLDGEDDLDRYLKACTEEIALALAVLALARASKAERRSDGSSRLDALDNDTPAEALRRFGEKGDRQ